MPPKERSTSPMAIKRNRSSTLTGPTHRPSNSESGPSRLNQLGSTPRNITAPASSAVPPLSAAADSLHQLADGSKRPRLQANKTSHARVPSWPSPPVPIVTSLPSAPAVPTRASLDAGTELLYPRNRVQLSLHTYRPNNNSASSQPSPLPSSSSSALPPTCVHFAHDAIPWKVRPGEYLEIRRIKRPGGVTWKGMASGPSETKTGGEALKGLSRKSGRDTFVFRVGEDKPHVPLSQIHVPETVAAAFRLQHRMDVEVNRLFDPVSAEIDYVELRFSQYLGRADMWRLAMSLEGSGIHVGEKLTLAGGAIRAEVQGIWRGGHRHASGILTAKTKTIYRSKSAQVYLFIQLCQETWEFDEDGERYYEKVVHGLLPELFTRWNERGSSHLVTIILFGRLYYDDEDITYMEEYGLTMGLMKDFGGRWCRDFYRVVVDFERRPDWSLALAEIKRRIERSEREILMDFHLSLMKDGSEVPKRLLGTFSFAYQGNVLEALNLALNPFDEHYVDRDLSRTGLAVTIITPGTGHFAVDKNLLRMTTERMIDHGTGLDLICVTKMPLHSVPLFSYVSTIPKGSNPKDPASAKPATPDLLYFDARFINATDVEYADAYSIPRWVQASYYSKAHDKPFRKDRFIPRCKMYEIQMMGILDHHMTTVIVPRVDQADGPAAPAEERKLAHERFDSAVFKLNTDVVGPDLVPVKSIEQPSSVNGGMSYQSARLLAVKEEERRNSLSPNGSRSPSPAGSSRPLPVTSSPFDSPASRLRDVPPFEPLDLHRTELRSSSPAPSSLSLGRSTRARSPSRASEPSIEPSSGASTPKSTPVKKLNSKASKSSFGARFGANWLLSTLSGRSQPSFPTAATETVIRQDVSPSGKSSPETVSIASSPALPRPVPGAPIVTPSTPSPSKLEHKPPVTQPVPIASRKSQLSSEDELGKSLQASLKISQSMNDSWVKAAAANFNRGKTHVTVNPCNPSANDLLSFGEGRRWQHISPKPGKESQHVVKWTSITTPACLPLTTDFMPTPEEIQEFYEFNSYDIACYPDQVSFLVRPDAAQANLPLAVMREMASQRLSQNFQFITLPHNTQLGEEEEGKASATRKVLFPGDSTKEGLRVGGASEVLRSAHGAIYLLWSNHIHRLAFDTAKQSVTVQRFVRKVRHYTPQHNYTCLVWPYQMNGYQAAEATFKYPNVEAKLNFNYLDRLIAGEEEDLTSSLKYWRTRYILIPSGKDPMSVQGVVPKGEDFNHSEILMAGASKVLEVLGRYQWTPPGEAPTTLRLLPTTFDPSACVLDDGLMTELERLTKGEQQRETGKSIEGMTLQNVGEMMCQPNNGLVIRDRWWNFSVHEDSFTGEQFCDWIYKTFTDVKTREEAAEWGQSLFDKGLIEHVTAAHGFLNYGHFFYRLRRDYDLNRNKRKKPAKTWFGGRPAQDPHDLIERHAQMSTSPSATAPLGKLGQTRPTEGKKKKIKMTQRIIVDLDPGKKSDRAEVAVLHADIVHNAYNAFHFELNWLGVTAGLLDELRAKCAAQAERYGLRFVEAPVEQIKDVSRKCAYRAAIPIPLALAPPVILDLPLRLPERGSGQTTNFFEYAILTEKFGFVLDVEASSRYPENIQVEYSYRGKTEFEYSQFCHRSGLALVQCIGGTEGFLWSDNRLSLAAPVRGRGVGSTEAYPNAPVPARLTRQEEVRQLRADLEAFCSDAEALRAFYEEITPPPPGSGLDEIPQEQGDEKADGDEAEKDEENGEKENVLDGEGRSASPTQQTPHIALSETL